ncbi:MAG: endoflagellar motor protein [Deltaproteobacteria bacterium]|nr:endoflagellar motor protein [Deltaproteobacteria bacterium]
MVPCRRLLTAFAAVLALGTGCVSKKKYTELEVVLAKTREAVRDRDEERRDLESRLEVCAQDRKQLGQCQEDLARIISEKGQLTSDIQEMTAALVELARQQKEAESRIAEYRGVVDKFQALEAAGKLKVRVVDGRVVLELATDVLFASGRATLNRDGKAALLEVATILATLPDKRFQIEGHTDNVPIRTAQFPSNWELAADRSISVVKTLIEGGMAPEAVSAASYGEFRPIAANETREQKASNRRIEIVMVPDLSQLPGFDELEALGASD